MKTTYKGYEIDNCTGDRFIIRLNGVHMDTVRGSLACAHFCIDSHYEDMTPQPVDVYRGLDLDQVEGEPTSEEINKACGVKEVCSFMEAVKANTSIDNDIPKKSQKLTKEQQNAYWDAYHEGYKQAQRELNHIVNP